MIQRYVDVTQDGWIPTPGLALDHRGPRTHTDVPLSADWLNRPITDRLRHVIATHPNAVAVQGGSGIPTRPARHRLAS